ncbi:hypothetical protein Scep_021668 [Stephania cephalantha]|uniref:Uncharacterized protein n=1 Tax=Stephania cephalantha TaxID=152367 RepID=A0AAP0F4R6_9MAGN
MMLNTFSAGILKDEDAAAVALALRWFLPSEDYSCKKVGSLHLFESYSMIIIHMHAILIVFGTAIFIFYVFWRQPSALEYFAFICYNSAFSSLYGKCYWG